jgi:hypothetical protein
MGWTFPYYATRKSVIAELTDHYVSENKLFERTCLAKCYKGSNFKGTLYAVFENKHFNADGTLEKTVRYIFVGLLQCRKMDGQMTWGYKDLEESMGPGECGCPVSYFKLVPVPPNNWARLWRERCVLRQKEVALRVKLNRAIRKGEIDRNLAQAQYDEFKKNWITMMEKIDAEHEAEHQKWLDEAKKATAEQVTA